MSNIKSWDEFLESMEHELPNCPINLQTSAYRVDDNKSKPLGIRSHCKILNPADNSTIKTCDYFHLIDNKFLCVEFSDLAYQKETRDESINKILKNEKIAKSERDRISHLCNSEVVISDELAQKIIDTDFILRQLSSNECKNFISDVPNISEFSRYFLIVYHAPNLDEVDNARFGDSQQDSLFSKEQERLKRKLGTTSFYFIDIKGIYWLNIELFKQQYC